MWRLQQVCAVLAALLLVAAGGLEWRLREQLLIVTCDSPAELGALPLAPRSLVFRLHNPSRRPVIVHGTERCCTVIGCCDSVTYMPFNIAPGGWAEVMFVLEPRGTGEFWMPLALLYDAGRGIEKREFRFRGRVVDPSESRHAPAPPRAHAD